MVINGAVAYTTLEKVRYVIPRTLRERSAINKKNEVQRIVSSAAVIAGPRWFARGAGISLLGVYISGATTHVHIKRLKVVSVQGGDRSYAKSCLVTPRGSTMRETSTSMRLGFRVRA